MISAQKKINIIFSDIDGTLLKFGSKTASDEVRSAIRLLKRNNVAIYLVTSRVKEILQEFINDLGIGHEPMVVDGGATVIYADTHKIIWRQWLDSSIIRNIINRVYPYCSTVCCTPDYNPLGYDQVEAMLNNGKLSFKAAPSIFIVYPKKNNHKIVSELRTIPKIQYSLPMSYEGSDTLYGIQITANGVDKYLGAKQLLNHIRADNNQGILAIGDGSNDLPLFKIADIRVAMGNSNAILMKSADFITCGVDNDGFVEAMDRFGLI